MPRIEPRIIPDDYYSYTLKDLNTLVEALKRFTEAQEIMRIDQAAEFLSCSASKMHQLCRKGKLPYHKLDGIGGKLFIRQELIDFVKRH